MYDDLSIEGTLSKAKELVDSHLGVITHIREVSQFPGEPLFFQYTARLSNLSLLVNGAHFPGVGTGSALTQREAKARAIGEALERYCGSIYFKEDLIWATFNELGDAAVDPHELPQCSVQEYGPRTPVVPLQETASLAFARVYSLIRRRSLFLPASYVYLSYQFSTRAERITIPVSTGLACGPELESAILAGIYEAVERDALMLLWFKRLAVPKVDISSVRDRSITERLKRLEEANLEPHFFYMTADIPIPSVLMILLARTGVPPAVTVAAASHADPLIAFRKVIDEGVATRKYTIGCVRQLGGRQPIVHDYSRITTFEDHTLLYAHPAMKAHLEFLLGNKDCIDVNHINAHLLRRYTLRDIVNMLRAKEMDILVADLTTQEVAEVGFRVVKVIIPQLQPLSPDHNARFLANRRLHDVPKRLGLRSTLNDEAEINEIPHPFA
jgi:ribosomal protein S12 methylthiotransferase accessory factor